MYRIFSFKLLIATLCGFLLLMSIGFGTTQAKDIPGGDPGSSFIVVCTPDSSSNVRSSVRTAFPYATNQSPNIDLVGCGNTFYWGWVTAGQATGTASWNIQERGTCEIDVFIPSNHAGARNAQYFIHDGSKYVANVLVDQQLTTGWKKLGQWTFSTNPFITLQDLSPTGWTGWEIAASAMSAMCH